MTKIKLLTIARNNPATPERQRAKNTIYALEVFTEVYPPIINQNTRDSGNDRSVIKKFE